MVSALASSVSLRSGTALSAPRPVARKSSARVMPVRALSDTNVIIGGVQSDASIAILGVLIRCQLLKAVQADACAYAAGQLLSTA